jgi:thiol-disulfide isomerase/thioredoxin
MSVARVLPLALALSALFAAPAAAAPTVEDALAIKPRQKGVDCSQLSAEEIKQASIKQDKEAGASALVVRGPSGEVLRAFADTNGDRVVDRWSFYKDGLEVYREFDADNDKKAEEFRWLGGGGSRWGTDTNADGVIDVWKTLSAEEATAEIVTAIRDRDVAAFSRLLPSKADLEAAGFTGEQLASLMARAAAAPDAFAKGVASQKDIGADSRWSSMLTPQPPGTLAAGTDDLKKDVMAYDNVVALVEGSKGNGQVFIGSLLKCGDAWRPVDVPQLSGGSAEIAEAFGFFTPRAPGRGGEPGAGDVAENLKPMLAKLREIEAKMSAADPVARRALAGEYVGQLEQTVAASADADKPFWNNQLVETLAAYVQEGIYPDGIAKLEKLAEAVKGDDAMSAFIAFRLIQARYAVGMEQPGAEGEKLQKTWFDDLQAFADTYPKAPESAEALLQLAFRDEFEGRDQDAVARYAAIASNFPESAQARKATGAVRRLESVGKPLALAGTTLDGKRVAVESYKGVPVLVHYWSTDCEPCKVELAQIRELQAKYGGKKFAVIGVALDGDKTKLAKFLQSKPLSWPQLHEPGGLDSRLAEEFGVMALPTMVLVGADGAVVDRNVSITGLEKKLDELITGEGK